MDVIDFAAAKEARTPHWEGRCRCIGCKHEWHGVAPIGVMFVDCPSCGEHKGHPYYPFGASDGDLVFQCVCGSEALTVFKRAGRFRTICMACGADQTAAIYGDPA